MPPSPSFLLSALGSAGISAGSVLLFPRVYQRLEDAHPGVLAIAVLLTWLLTFGFSIAMSKRIQHGQPLIRVAFDAIGASLAGVVVLFAVIIVFGAPLTQLQWKTFLLAALLSSLTTIPLTAHVGLDLDKWIDLLLNFRLRDSHDALLALSSIGALAGAYLGTIFIPLDWDRPWQQWPLPCVYGCAYGHLAGIATAVLLAFAGYKRERKEE